MLLPNDQGSIPELVMRTGIMRTMNPADARQDILPQHVMDLTSPHGITTQYDRPIAPPTLTTAAVAQTATATPPLPIAPAVPPPGMHGVMLGEFQGKPLVRFHVNASPDGPTAQGAVLALRQAAQAVQNIGQGALPPELIGGPMAALMRGGAIQLHFKNGVVVRTAL